MMTSSGPAGAPAGAIGVTVLYEGRVQGVGFRYTTQRIAAGFSVGGYVRNLPDGRVEVVAEGAADQVEAFLGRVETEMVGHIHDRRVQRGPATGRFGPAGSATFSIRY